ncbi:MAG TPA: glycosyltransferase family 39 protein [Chloroflexia bacterium]|nr:glycosyltransferase family 39 protein [Chloroflexia bacterium]
MKTWLPGDAPETSENAQVEEHATPQTGVVAGDGVADTASNGSAPPQKVEAEVEASPAKKPGLRERIGQSWVWRTRGLWLGLLALALAMYAQKLTTVDRMVIPSIRWYALAIIVMLIAWAGTYKNKSCLVVPANWAKRIIKHEVPPKAEAKTETKVPPTESIKTTLPVRSRPAQPVAPPRVETTLPVRSKAPVAEAWQPGKVESDGDGRQPIKGRVRGSAGRLNVEQPQAQERTAAQEVITPAKRSRFAPVAAWQAFAEKRSIPPLSWVRYVLAFIALAINLWAAGQLRADYFSAVGGFTWLFSLILLVVAFLGERRPKLRDMDEDAQDVEDRTDVDIPRKVEIFVVAGIMALALALRIYKLGDPTGGMHGDEGETGMDALNIIAGNRVSPFMTGWFSHPNFSFWSIALTMQVFGVSLFGLRLFSAFLGTLTVLPLYLLVRMWFGKRAAIIAAFLWAVMDVSLYFGRLGLNNITTPFFLVTGFYFLFRGLRSKRTLDFILSGYAFMLTMYFYFGGRLTPYIVAALIGYLFLFMPLLRIPGAYWQFRKVTPGLSHLSALRQAAWTQVMGVGHYFGQIVILAIACISFASPWWVYYTDHKAELEARPNDKLIFNPANEARMASSYGATHTPLYLGLRMPTPDDIYPLLPVVFEQTPVSVMLTPDGFWPRVLWGQTTTTLSIFTYRADASSFYTFTGEPAAKPIEAALIILGLALSAWRWRDARMATLSLWFWATLFAGGVLTIDAPYMPRIVGLVPVLAIVAAIPLNKLAAEFVNAASTFSFKWAQKRQKVMALAGQAVSGLAIACLLSYLGSQNYSDYFNRYLAAYFYPEVTGQAVFVGEMNQRVMSEGRPTPKYYDLGMHVLYWGHGDNRFLNHGTEGQDMTNPSNELPVINNGDKDVIFMVWNFNIHYLSAIRAYYPSAEVSDYIYGPPGSNNRLFTSVRVTKEPIEAQRVTVATYTPAGGAPIQQIETVVGTSSKNPAPQGLTYPVEARWTGGIVTPAFGRYRFILKTPQAGSLTIDGTPVLTATSDLQQTEVELLLAKGVHEVQLSGTLVDADTQVNLQWAAGPTEASVIPRQYLWNGTGRALYGEIRAFGPDLLAPAPAEGQPPALMSRIDGFLGFRHSPEALGGGVLQGIWKGTLKITQPGIYGFDVYSNGDSVVFIDGNVVVNNIRGGDQPHNAPSQVELQPGDHTYELRYNWSGGTGYLEAYWTPPGGQSVLIGPDALHTTAGIVQPGAVSEPPPVQLQLDAPPRRIEPDAVIGQGAGMLQPRGLDIGPDGNIYVGDRGNGRIMVFAPDGKVLRTFGKAAAQGNEANAGPGELVDIKDLAVGKDGNIYVLEGTILRIHVYNPTGEIVKVYTPDQLGLYGANGIDVGPDNSIYIADTGRNRVLKLTPMSENQPPEANVSLAGSDQDKLEQPVDALADWSGTGSVYMIDLKERVAQYGPDGSVAKQWRVLVGRDDGGSRLAVSPDGAVIYMSDPDRSRVAVLNVATGEITFFGTPGSDAGQFRNPSGIGVDTNGRVYVLDRTNNNIQIFTIDE